MFVAIALPVLVVVVCLSLLLFSSLCCMRREQRCLSSALHCPATASFALFNFLCTFVFVVFFFARSFVAVVVVASYLSCNCFSFGVRGRRGETGESGPARHLLSSH